MGKMELPLWAKVLRFPLALVCVAALAIVVVFGLVVALVARDADMWRDCEAMIAAAPAFLWPRSK